METQFKKGVMELCVLSVLKIDDYYGYEVVNKINEYLEVTTNTIYPILRRLTNESILAIYEVNYGDRKRKYYTLTKYGKKYFDDKIKEWNEFNIKVNMLLKGARDDDE